MKRRSNHLSFFVIIFSILLASCSVQNKINNSAQRDLLSDPALTDAHVGIYIYDATDNKELYSHDGNKYFVPASNTKIPTCYAVMKHLGDSLVGIRYRYDSYWNKFTLFPTGDPTFLHPDFKTHPVLDFFKKNSDKDYSADFGDVWNENHWGNGWAWDDYAEDYMVERSPMPIHGNMIKIKRTGNFKAAYINDDSVYIEGLEVSPKYFKNSFYVIDDSAMISNKINFTRDFSGNKLAITYSSNEFDSLEVPFITGHEHQFFKVLKDWVDLKYSYGITDTLETYHLPILRKEVFPYSKYFSSLLIHSQPTDSVLKIMMHRSDNFYAEQLLLMVSNEMLGYMNDDAIIDSLLKTDLKDLPQRPRWVDGSGLSRYNLFTPQDLVFILRKMKDEFGLERMKVLLPTGGEGTFSRYYKDMQGRFFAKTGSLSNQTSISGYIITQKNKLLIFSVLVNNHRGPATPVRTAVERFLTGLYRDL